MAPAGDSILYLDSYTTRDPAEKVASDAIGYGITASGAIRRGPADRGSAVRSPHVPPIADQDAALRALSWALSGWPATSWRAPPSSGCPSTPS